MTSFSSPEPTEDVISAGLKGVRNSSEEQTEAHKKTLLGAPLGSEWAERLEHKWTARLDLADVSFQDLIPTPQTLWLETQIRPNPLAFESEVIGLSRQTGEASFRSRDKRLLAANANLALFGSKIDPKGYVGVSNGSAAAFWQMEYSSERMSLTSTNVVASAAREKNLIISQAPLPSAPSDWRDLSKPGAWRVRNIQSRGKFWVTEYHGAGKRMEVRRASDSQLMWHNEYVSDDKVHIYPDSHGWLVHFGDQIDSYDSDGQLQANWKCQEEMISLGTRYSVGRHPLGEGSIWGCPEPSLRVAERHTGKTRTLPRDLFENRTCYVVSGDILWCVCENQKILRAYNLHSRKVVNEISPLPSGPHSNHRSSMIQFMVAYGTDLYITSKAGLILAFGEPS